MSSSRPETLRKNPSESEVKRMLWLESLPLKRWLQLHDIQPRYHAEAIRLELLAARRERRTSLYWDLAVACHLAGDKPAALEAARKYINSRQSSPTEIDKASQAARQRLKRALVRKRPSR